jgi:hypothetical protein
MILSKPSNLKIIYKITGGRPMDATFMEKIVRKQKDKTDYLKITGLFFAFLVLIVLSFSVQIIAQFAPILIVGAIWGIWWVISGLNREYEYSVTENFIDIDCIIAQRKRTRAFSGDAKEFEICARMSTDLYREYAKGNRTVLNFAPTMDNKVNYFIVTKNNAKKAKTKGQTVIVIFEPDERMVPSMKKYNPSKVKVDGLY